jgi:signal transduction histidine kinase
VRQILLNLVGNAIKFTQPGGWVRLSCERWGERVHVLVSDNGPGIALEKQATVFDPFIQVDRRLSNPRDGVGLGLAISRDLARAMGGDLGVASVPGEGSTFTLRLPAVD